MQVYMRVSNLHCFGKSLHPISTDHHRHTMCFCCEFFFHPKQQHQKTEEATTTTIDKNNRQQHNTHYTYTYIYLRGGIFIELVHGLRMRQSEGRRFLPMDP